MNLSLATFFLITWNFDVLGSVISPGGRFRHFFWHTGPCKIRYNICHCTANCVSRSPKKIKKSGYSYITGGNRCGHVGGPVTFCQLIKWTSALKQIHPSSSSACIRPTCMSNACKILLYKRPPEKRGSVDMIYTNEISTSNPFSQ